MIIVCGASGFIGFYLVNELKKAGYDVLAVDKSGTDEVEFFKEQGIPFLQADITKEDEFKKLPSKNIEAFVNLACVQPANMPQEQYDPAKYISVNVLGVVNCLKYCNNLSVPKFIHTISHRNVQRLWEMGELITEESPKAVKYTGKFAMFSISESAALDIIENFRQEYGMQCVVLRLPSVYGFGHHENFYKDGKVVKTGLGVFIEKAIKAEDIELWGDESKGRDIVYVKDVVNAIIKAVEVKKANGLFNIAMGRMLTLRQQVESVINVFSSKNNRSRIRHLPEKPNSIDSCVYDISKAKRELGWKPLYNFEEMLIDYKNEMEKGKLLFLLSRKHRMTDEK
jgi:UDP-glucose 4-epimerase